MPSINKTFSHSLGRAEAVARIKKAIAAERNSGSSMISSPSEDWVSDHECEYSLRAFGFRIEGSVVIGESNVTVDVKLPMLAGLVKGTIESQLSQEVRRILS